MSEAIDNGRRRLAVFLATSGHSGVDRIMKNLLPAFADRGVQVDLLHVERHGPHLDLPYPNINLVRLGRAHVNTSMPALLRYLRQRRPQVLLADKDKLNRLAILAPRLTAVDTRVVVRLGTTVSENLRDRGWLQRFSQYASIRLLYRHADAIIVPSQGAAADLAAIAGLPLARISVVPNPVITPDFTAKLQAEPPHPWLREKTVPVVLAVGELSQRKDFATLVAAFAQVRRRRPLKLIILGKGREQKALQQLIAELGLGADIDLAGFQANPYAYMAAADLFVQTSICEGFGIALAEALGAGLPCVATDCPSGPKEILADGALGALVPVKDVTAVAQGIEAMLDAPPSRQVLLQAAARYSLAASADAYLHVLGLDSHE